MLDVEEKDHIGLVYRVAQDLASNDETCIRVFGRDVSEYLGEGFLALQLAKKNYKPELGYKFSTYATSVIKDRLIESARKSSLIKVSFQARYHAAKIMQGKEEDSGRNSVKDALRVMRKGVVQLTDQIQDERRVDSTSDSLEELRLRLDDLDEKTKSVLSMRFGLDGQEPRTLEEIAKSMDPPVTREWVRQIEKNGLMKLRETMIHEA